MDSTVLMAAWIGLPDPGLMPPVSADDRENTGPEPACIVRVKVRAVKRRKALVVRLRSTNV